MNCFDVHIDQENHLVKITASGELALKDGEKIITTARTTAAEHRFNLLYDIRQATTNVSYADWYNLARQLDVYNRPETRRIKAAVLISQDDKSLDSYKFYEIVTENVGLQLRFFTNEEEACKWVNGTLRADRLNVPQ